MIKRKIQLILPVRSYFMRYFVNSIIFRAAHRLLYCVFIKVDFEKTEMLEIFIFLQRSVSLERKTRYAVIEHTNTSNGTKNPNIFVFVFNLGYDVTLFQYPLKTSKRGNTSTTFVATKLN